MRIHDKKNFPVAKIRRFLEPGPIVLVTSAHKGERNIMTLGWHMVMGFEPSLVGCYVWDENHSFSLIRRSKECVINVPTFDLVNAVIGVGNSHGYSLFVFEMVKAHVATSPRYPTTVHYRGDGVFMVSGRNISYRRRFKRANL